MRKVPRASTGTVLEREDEWIVCHMATVRREPHVAHPVEQKHADDPDEARLVVAGLDMRCAQIQREYEHGESAGRDAESQDQLLVLEEIVPRVGGGRARLCGCKRSDGASMRSLST